MRNDLMALIIIADCPIGGFYPGSFSAGHGCVTRGEPSVEKGESLVRQVVADIAEQLDWAGVQRDSIRSCLSRIEWIVECKPAEIRMTHA